MWLSLRSNEVINLPSAAGIDGVLYQIDTDSGLLLTSH